MLDEWDLYFVVLYPPLMIMIQVSDSSPEDPLLFVLPQLIYFD